MAGQEGLGLSRALCAKLEVVLDQYPHLAGIFLFHTGDPSRRQSTRLRFLRQRGCV
jgi:hypothetical protein